MNCHDHLYRHCNPRRKSRKGLYTRIIAIGAIIYVIGWMTGRDEEYHTEAKQPIECTEPVIELTMPIDMGMVQSATARAKPYSPNTRR